MFDRLPEKFRSRKLWVTLSAFVSAILSEIFGWEVDPEIIFGLAAAIGSYNIGQALVDRVTEAGKIQVEALKDQLENEIRNLSAENFRLQLKLAQTESGEAGEESSQGYV